MRITSLAATLLAAFLIVGCSKQAPEQSAPVTTPVEVNTEAESTTEAAAVEAPTSGVEPVQQQLVNGQLPGYNPNLVVKEVKWADPAHKAAWEARKAELQRLRAEGKLPQEGQ